jgi:hypothetical protein
LKKKWSDVRSRNFGFTGTVVNKTEESDSKGLLLKLV